MQLTLACMSKGHSQCEGQAKHDFQCPCHITRKSGREYELQYLGLVGNVFSQSSIENCQKIEYNPQNIHQMSRRV
jgi:hypothetical protein